MENIRVYSHSACLSKENGEGHPERKERLESILDSIQRIDDISIDLKEAPKAQNKDINLVHPQSYLEEIFEMIPSQGLVGVEKEPYADTLLCPDSKEAILRACGSGISASKDLMDGSSKRVFCAVRPPGHHAETSRVNGFCFLNNAAVAARYLQSNYDIKKIAIIDFDVHHGNGTQEIFYSDSRVLMISIHQWPLYPGTGSEEEVGELEGQGFTVNIPLPPGSTGSTYRSALDQIVVPLVEDFQPDWILVSAGFDAHREDPLTDMGLTSGDFADLTANLFSLAPKNHDGLFSKKGIYAIIRHPIYTVVIFHLPIIVALFYKSFVLLFFLPAHYIFWSHLVEREEEYLVGIFGEDYVDYMAKIPRFVPWR